MSDDGQPTALTADPIALVAPGVPSRARRGNMARRFVRSRGSMIALGFLVLVVLVAIFAPWIEPFKPDQTAGTNTFAKPFSGGHILGTDNLGRDQFSRLIDSCRVAIRASVIAVGVAVAAGVPPGLVAGFLRGRVDWILSRIADALQSMPPLMLAIGIVASLGLGLRNAMIALGIVFSSGFFRLTRAAVMEVREETYIEASRSIGTPTTTIIRTRVLPNVLPPLLVQSALVAGFALIAEAGLSLLGLGVQPPQASWGSMLSQGYNFLLLDPWQVVWPGLAISLTVLACNVVGDGLRDSIGKETRVER
jgi:peptide/nickel transport system permease protein